MKKRHVVAALGAGLLTAGLMTVVQARERSREILSAHVVNTPPVSLMEEPIYEEYSVKGKVVESSLRRQQFEGYSYALAIPVLEVEAPMVLTKNTPQGKMAVPDNFTEIGMYSYSASLAEKGNTVVGAHVDNGGRTAGVFKYLHTLREGDMIVVTDSGQGIEYVYVVDELRIYERSQEAPEVFTRSGQHSKLVLITCHGTWIPKEYTYTDRLAVFATLVQQNSV